MSTAGRRTGLKWQINRVSCVCVCVCVRPCTLLYGQDEATNTFGYPRPNFMAASYVANPVLSATAPAGGYTRGVWVTDRTPPTMFFSAFDALSEDSLCKMESLRLGVFCPGVSSRAASTQRAWYGPVPSHSRQLPCAGVRCRGLVCGNDAKRWLFQLLSTERPPGHRCFDCLLLRGLHQRRGPSEPEQVVLVVLSTPGSAGQGTVFMKEVST